MAEQQPETAAAEQQHGEPAAPEDPQPAQSPAPEAAENEAAEAPAEATQPTGAAAEAEESKGPDQPVADDAFKQGDEDDQEEVRPLNLESNEMTRQSSVNNLGGETPVFNGVENTGEALLDRYGTRPVEKNEQDAKIQLEMSKIPETVEPAETNREAEPRPQTVASPPVEVQNAGQGIDKHYQTSPRVAATSERHMPHTPELDEVDEDYDSVTPIEINKDQLLRLIKVGVLSEADAEGTYDEIQARSEAKVTLSKKQSARYMNGQTFGRYLVFLKTYMKQNYNQIWSFRITVMHDLKSGFGEDVCRANWNDINNELDKISITILEENLNKIAQGDQAQVDRIFWRIERYSKMITDPGFLNYEGLTEEQKYNEDLCDSSDHNLEITEENLSEMFSLRQETMRGSAIDNKNDVIKTMLTRKATKNSSRFQRPGTLHEKGPEKSLTMLENSLRLKAQESELLKKSQDGARKNSSHIRVEHDFIQGPLGNNMISPKPITDTLHTEGDITEKSKFSPRQLSVEKREPKKVKDGVDILGLDAKKPIVDCESSLELILVTLSSAFQMNPKQAAALLTNNNQYLITACIKGVKGGKYEPLLAWYESLINYCGILAELLTLELQQLPESAKQTFVKVMAAIGCGFYSYHTDLVLMTITFFKSLFTRIKDSTDMHAQALKWFLAQAPAQEIQAASEETTAEQLISEEKSVPQPPNQQVDMINAGGLRLSLYALGKHREATKPAMELYDALCDNDSQVYTLYTAEIQKHTKSVLEYMELVGEFLPIMSEEWSSKAIESGLIDFWLDLASREAENDFKVQNKEKVLAIALLTEIWLLFTDYVDDKEAVTNTLIFVFKRTVSERTKSIRLLSIAYLFKVLEKLIELKKKAALTLYRTLIYSLVESPFDPTIRELYLANFNQLFRQNPKMPVEWLVEPLLKQLQAQLGVSFVLKIFDFTFMLALLEHPKFKEEHASHMFALFSTVSLEDVSYASAAHEVMLTTLSRFLGSSKQSSDLLQKAKEHIAYSFESLLDLEPISKAAAQAQMRRQQRQNALKMRQGQSIGGRSSNLSIQAPSITYGTPSSSKPPLKAKDLLSAKTAPGQGSISSLSGISKSNYQKDMQRRLKKSLMITFLLKAQALNISVLNLSFLKELLFDSTREFKGTYGYFNKGHLELLKAYGDPENLIIDHELDPQLADPDVNINQNRQPRSNANSVKGTPYSKLQGPSKVRNSTPASQRNHETRQLAANDGVVAIYNEQDEMEASRSVVPFRENESQNVRGRSLGGAHRARAMQEIEKIKKQKRERELKKEAEQQKNRIASAKRKKEARQKVEQRKQELGVADRVPSKLPALTYGGGDERPNASQKSKQVQFVKIDEEEDRDRDTVLEFMRKYQKLWRHVFQKYQNTAHKTNTSIQLTSFDTEKKQQVLNFAEIMRLLKDHGVYPNMLNKEELSQMVRLVNQKGDEPRTDISTLTYAGYQTFLIQLAVHIFSKPPMDLSSQPMVKSLEALVETFTEATKKRNLSTLLYEDPDAVLLSQKEKDNLKSLNEAVKEQPDYPMPEGYLKVKEKIPVTEYKVPESAARILGEPKTVCAEIVDELMSKIFDFHFLEPMVTMQEQFRVKPSMTRSIPKRGERSDRAEALSIIRRAEEKRGSIESGEQFGRNKVSLPKLPTRKTRDQSGPSLAQLPPLYSKLIKKQPKKNQPIYADCAFVLENVVRRVCGEDPLRLNDDLDERSSSVPDSREGGSLSSNQLGGAPSGLDDTSLDDIDGVKFDQVRRKQEKLTLLERKQKERKRQERQKKLKEDLAKLKAEKEQKDAEDVERKKFEQKKKKEQDKRLAERLQKQRDERVAEIARRNAEQEEKKEEAKAEDAEQKQEELERKKEEKREFFRKQQEKMNNQFKSMTDQRKANSQNEQQKAFLEKKKKDSLKQKIDQQNKKGQGQSERKMAAEIVAFLQKPEVSSLFRDHEKSLTKYFKFYCRQNRVELGQDLQYRLEHLDFGAFNKLGLQSKIVPVLISTEQMKLTFRNTLKYQLNNFDLQVVSPEENASGSNKQAPVINDPATQMDYDQFKQALVRIAMQGQELLGGQSEEQKQRKAQLDEKRRQAEQRKKELLKNRQEQRARLENETLQEMKNEFTQKQKQIQNAMSKSPSKRLDKVQSDGELIKTDDNAAVQISEEDFQRWLKQQDNIGNGLNHRVAEKLNNASKPKQAAAAADGAAAGESTPVQESPAKLINQPDVTESQEVDTAPLLRAKQTQAQKTSNQAEGADAELDIAFISENTVKALFEFMKVEAGDEGERNVDQVLAAQSSYQGRARVTVNNTNIRRGVSKEPTVAAAAATAQEQS